MTDAVNILTRLSQSDYVSEKHKAALKTVLASLDMQVDANARLFETNERLRDQCGRNTTEILDGIAEKERLRAEVERQHQVLIARGEENERLRGALEGQPVIKSEWEEKCAQVKALRDENEFHADKAKALLVSIDAALALHQPMHPDHLDSTWCTTCEDSPPYPCPTVKALEGERA